MTENTATEHAQIAERIVVGVDSSDNAARAADWAACEAVERGLAFGLCTASVQLCDRYDGRHDGDRGEGVGE